MTLLVSRSPVQAPPPVARGLLPLIGNTPIVEITRLDAGTSRLFLKLESANPGGSIKDRPALAMVEAAERAGQLKPGGTHRRSDRRQHRPRSRAWSPRQGLQASCSSFPTR